jgi:DNA-binding transcriptional ArsR family regulator
MERHSGGVDAPIMRRRRAPMLRPGAKHARRALRHTAGMNTNQIAHVAALVGEPARTAMLLALMDGRALTARELAEAGRVSAATASRHLGLLVEAGLLVLTRQGRHRYHRLASAEVARLLEGLMQLAVRQVPAHRPMAVGPRDAALRTARTCYDHIAGRLGVAMAAHLLEQGAIAFDEGVEGGLVTPRAAAVLRPLGLAVPEAGAARRPLCRPCLDWSERRPHVAGRLGALLCAHCLERGWLRRAQSGRVLEITPPGAVALRGWLGVERWNAVAGA